MVTRIPAVPTISTKLPKGADGGKEFARIVDLLLFHDAKINGSIQTIFDDSSGDYRGLDSLSGMQRTISRTGYQYKYFPSPLSDQHRSEIVSSLKTAIDGHSKSQIEKWVLVTPNDLTETSRRKSGGDVSWFEGLREKYNAPFQIEHIGHTKIIYFFIQCPAICLFYYPELVHDGPSRRKAINTLRTKYNNNLVALRGRVEFIGMSVYKEEASRGVPLEHIYIPLGAVPETSDDSLDITPRINPKSFLEPGQKTIVLGDPGSGKSTLLSFLALAGSNSSIQKRYKTRPDGRLPILVTLRRFADELKKGRKLSILDFIIETTSVDFNIPAIDIDFFEHYLATGKAILLLDGLDELPNSIYKKQIRDQIVSFSASYPGNSTIVTSRIVGYEPSLRFPEDEFSHYRLARLRISDIQSFIVDWYRARTSLAIERRENSTDLFRIIQDENNISIRELARNPLLLTIIALVHRIDAVLPDERVVLYQKCTETLLNTWYKWKFRDEDETIKGRTERRNRRRLEAIAYWMHCQSGSVDGRAVVPGASLKQFLSAYVLQNEQPATKDLEAADESADDFLDFVKKRTGLLIEVGDDQYSFVHLTFQEYLTATHLITLSEKDGVVSIWEILDPFARDPRWHEVFRLLIASLKSDESQNFLVEKFLEKSTGESVFEITLLSGLLVDGIASAETKSNAIFAHAARIMGLAQSSEQIGSMARSLRIWSAKSVDHHAIGSIVLNDILKSAPDFESALNAALAAQILGIVVDRSHISEDLLDEDRAAWTNYLVLIASYSRGKRTLSPEWKGVWNHHDLMALTSASQNAASAAGQAVTTAMTRGGAAQIIFRRHMLTLAGDATGPYTDLPLNTLAIGLASSSMRESEIRQYLGIEGGNPSRSIPIRRSSITHNKHFRSTLGQLRGDPHDIESDRTKDLQAQLKAHVASQFESRRSAIRHTEDLEAERKHPDTLRSPSSMPRDYWPRMRQSIAIRTLLISSLENTSRTGNQVLWRIAIEENFIDRIPDLLAEWLDVTRWQAVAARMESGKSTSDDGYFLGFVLLLDGWIQANVGSAKVDFAPLEYIRRIARLSTHPAVRIGLSISDTARAEPGFEALLSSTILSQDAGILRELRAAAWILPHRRQGDDALSRPARAPIAT